MGKEGVGSPKGSDDIFSIDDSSGSSFEGFSDFASPTAGEQVSEPPLSFDTLEKIEEGPVEKAFCGGTLVEEGGSVCFLSHMALAALFLSSDF